jgi:predicted permease
VIHPDDLDAEVRSHLAHRADDLEREGLSRTAAERQARLEFGGLEKHKDAVRDAEVRRGPGAWFTSMGRDLALATRRLRRARLFTMFSVVSLAVGVALPTTMYAFLRATIWADPAVDRPAELVVFTARGRYVTGSASEWRSAFSLPDVRDYVAAQNSLSAVAWQSWNNGIVALGQDGQSATPIGVSGRFFEVVGISPLLGRFIHPEDDRSGAPPVMVVSYHVWRTILGASRDAIGSVLHVKGEPFSVIGVAPVGFSGLDFGGPTRPMVWVPMSSAHVLSNAESLGRRDVGVLTLIGRMVPGADVARASAEAAAFGTELDREFPLRELSGQPQGSMARSWAATDYQSLRNAGIGRAAYASYVLLAIGGLVLVVACSNLANLSVARGTIRQPELVMRRALGATRGRLVRELLAESAIIALAGLAASVLLLRVLFVLCTIDLPVSNQNILSIVPVLDRHVLAYAAGAVVLALLMFGVEPAVQLTRTSIGTILPRGAGTLLPGTRRHRMLIRLQVAAAFALLVIASVTVHYSVSLSKDDSGVDLDQLAVGTVVFLPHEQFAATDRAQATETVLATLRATLGIERADAATGMPFGLTVTPLVQLSSPDRPAFRETTAFELSSTPGYFETVGVAIQRGRAFTAHDTAESAPVAILSAAAARAMFGSVDVIGRTIATRPLTGRTVTPPVITRTVVGVAGDTDVQSRGSRRSLLVHVPLTQTSAPFVTFVTRGRDPLIAASAIRMAVARALPGVAPSGVGPGVAMLAPAVPVTRVVGAATLVLGLTALGLSMIGLHGVLAYLLSVRRRELALRVALGATSRQVWWLSIREGLRPVIGGLTIGLLIGTFVRITVIGRLGLAVPALDLVMFLVVPMAFLAVAIAASAAPARRASRVDPSVVLRDA